MPMSPGLGGLNNRNLLLSVGGWKAEIKVQAGWSPEASLLGPQMATFSQCPHAAFSLCTSIPDVSFSSEVLPGQGPRLTTSFNRNDLLTALPPNSVTLGVRSSIYEFGGHNSVQRVSNKNASSQGQGGFSATHSYVPNTWHRVGTRNRPTGQMRGRGKPSTA